MNKRVMFQVINAKGLVDTSIGRKTIDDLELKELYKSFEVIYFLQPISYAYEAIERNIKDLENFICQISDPNNELVDGIMNHMEAISSLAEVQQRFTNLLSSANAFLNLAESKLKSEFGKESQKLSSWNDYRRKLHKKNISYRLMYELRNYALHYGLPVSSLKYDINNLASAIPQKKVKVNLSKVKILNSNYDWKSVRVDIDALDDDANLTKLIFEYADIISRIYQFLLKVFDSELSVCKDRILAFYETNNIPFECTAQIVTDWNEGDGLSNIKYESLPVNELAWLLRGNA
ncbi:MULTISPECIES: hypothetical protein [unclassified Pseudoalteromonas]|uniref:hypothetical protein n=1 Tax=unclassified Pseudoalteromonas TaxID=194690 RepID=UPI00117AD121|nr:MULTISPECIES: hypothetical protein [unclassified Pseudoalteromonas]MDP2636338.1 hypothetical protein [Pseudoalteromonas sp. 1_MG-2023]